MLNALSVAEQRLAFFVVALLVGGLGVAEWRRSLPAPPPTPAALPGVAVDPADLVPPPAAPVLDAVRAGRIDLNTADAALLEALPGVGPAKAAAIIEDRNARGPFASVNDLDRVGGFGEKTVAGLAPYLTVGEAAAPTGPAPRPSPTPLATMLAPPLLAALPGATPVAAPLPRGATPPAGSPRAAPAPVAKAPGPLNINTATAAEFEALDGVGPVLAQRIVDYRATHGPFRSIDELDRVKGIGPAIMARNRHRLAVH